MKSECSNATDCECARSYCNWPMCPAYVKREREIADAMKKALEREKKK